LLVSLAILAVILVLVVNVIGMFRSISSSVNSRVASEQGAREAAGYVGRRLGMATLNSYFDYVDAAGIFRTPQNASSFTPKGYRLASDLHFIAGPAAQALGQPAATAAHPGSAVLFQAGFGVPATGSSVLRLLLNSCGFFIDFSQRTGRPAFLDGYVPDEPYRYRLVEVIEPTEKFSVFRSTKPATGDTDRLGYDTKWVESLLVNPQSIVADNVILLLVLPKVSPVVAASNYLAPKYLYDSRSWEKSSSDGTPSALSQNSLPPSVEIILVTISETSAKRIDTGSTPPLAGLFDGLFTDSAKLHATPGDEGDLARMEKLLRARNLDYRVAQVEIPILAARWIGQK
jgi:uncharacterized protein (TIGR02599 family)